MNTATCSLVVLESRDWDSDQNFACQNITDCNGRNDVSSYHNCIFDEGQTIVFLGVDAVPSCPRESPIIGPLGAFFVSTVNSEVIHWAF